MAAVIDSLAPLPTTGVVMSATGSTAAIASLAANAIGAAGNTAFDNSTTGTGYFKCLLELTVTFGTAPTAGSTIEVYLIPAPDGTNYSDTDNTTPPYALLAGTFAVRNTTSAQRISIDKIELGPFKYLPYVRNQTNQQISAFWGLKIFPYYEQAN
jgi:hypothetical protein